MDFLSRMVGVCVLIIFGGITLSLDSVIPLPEVNSTEPPPAFTVYVFLDTECPLSQNYTLTLRKIQADYVNQDLRFVAVFPAVGDTPKRIRAFIKEYQLPFETMPDPDLEWTKALSAQITPEAFLVNAAGAVLYGGKIDNWAVSLGKKRQVITQHFLTDAIEASLAGEPISVARTKAVGCFISRKNRIHD